MAEKDKSASQSSRWWEYYFIRYFFGTVTGAAIVLVFADSVEPVRKIASALLAPPQNSGAKDLTILAASGLAYCYIASAPMLVVHTLRAYVFAIFRSDASTKSLSGSRPAIAFTTSLWGPFAVLAISILSIGIYMVTHGWQRSRLGVICLLTTVATQLALILIAHRDKFRTIRRFYKQLSRARTTEEADEYVQSYRHMREHSNAYSIIILELVLAPGILAANDLTQLALVVLIWLLPSGYCWLVGTLLEVELANSVDDAITSAS